MMNPSLIRLFLLLGATLSCAGCPGSVSDQLPVQNQWEEQNAKAGRGGVLEIDTLLAASTDTIRFRLVDPAVTLDQRPFRDTGIVATAWNFFLDEGLRSAWLTEEIPIETTLYIELLEPGNLAKDPALLFGPEGSDSEKVTLPGKVLGDRPGVFLATLDLAALAPGLGLKPGSFFVISYPSAGLSRRAKLSATSPAPLVPTPIPGRDETGPFQRFPFFLRQAGTARLVLHDAARAPVYSTSARFEAGWGEFKWRLQNGQNQPVANGLYYFRIDFDPGQGKITGETKKFAIIR